MNDFLKRFEIKNKICVVTGGAGLIGKRHAQAILEGKGIPILLDVSEEHLQDTKQQLLKEYGKETVVNCFAVDITNRGELEGVCEALMAEYGQVDVLINNAANNPKVEGTSNNMNATKFDDFSLDLWNDDIAVGLTGAFLCAQVFGKKMEEHGEGVILNISSDYGIIAPDQRIYRKKGLEDEQQIVKPVSYSVVKHGIIGLTKYLATYWADKGIRVNTLCPASLYNGQDEEFVKNVSNLIPMGRMSNPDEYVCTVLYMISDASSYMTGATVVLDGGRTIW